MRKIIFSTTILFSMVFGSCADFTDIQPKGYNLLNRAEDLDLLLNFHYNQGYNLVRTVAISNGMLPYNILTPIPTLFKQEVKTLAYALTFWDETVDRAELTASDGIYQEIYRIVGQIANPILTYAGIATGSQILLNRIKAEAYVLRAWHHYLAVNIFAKAYNPATAATDGGVPYLHETTLMSTPAKKYTVQEVYDFILADLDAALSISELPNEGINTMRMGRSFAYAVKAKALMSMRRYDEALAAARASLAINNHVDNHNNMISTGSFSRPLHSSKEDLFVTTTSASWFAFSNEMIALFDPDAVLFHYMPLSATAWSMYGIPGLRVWDPGFTVATFSGAGITTVDMHLVEAECLLRSAQLLQAKAKIEEIRKNRILTDRYAPSPASTKAELFALLKQVWRSDNFVTFKDLIHLKRWNTETEFAETHTRTLTWDEGGVPVTRTFTLRPDSPLWVYPFPQTATLYNPNLTQNY